MDVATYPTLYIQYGECHKKHNAILPTVRVDLPTQDIMLGGRKCICPPT